METSIEETTIDTGSKQLEQCKMANRLINLYLSRQRSISTDGKIIESNTYSTDDRNAQANAITELLTVDIDDDKASIIERILNYESHVQRQESKVINGETQITTYESVISAFEGECRTKLTSALSNYIIEKAKELNVDN
ncbi:MAG: hypothetical protein R3Y51_06080 [Rikenellaceae bacterium]